MTEPIDIPGLLAQLRTLSTGPASYQLPEYQALADRYAREVHGFARGSVVDIADEAGQPDNMPILVETIELKFREASRQDERVPVCIRGPIFCNNPDFDGNAGEGTCAPHRGEKFLTLT